MPLLAAFNTAFALKILACVVFGGAAFAGSSALGDSAYMAQRPRLKWYWQQYLGPFLCLMVVSAPFLLPMFVTGSWRHAPLPGPSLPSLPSVERRPAVPER